MPNLREYGTGFLTGLTNVAQQQRADDRAEEDRKAQQSLAILQLGLANPGSFDVAAFLEEQGPTLGLGKGAGAKKNLPAIAQLLAPALNEGGGAEATGAPGAQAPQGGAAAGAAAAPSPFAGLEDLAAGGGPAATPGAAGVAGGPPVPSPGGIFLSPQRALDRRMELATQEQAFADEQFDARLAASGATPEEIERARKLRVGVQPPTVQFGAAGATPFVDGEPGETLPARPTAQAGLQRQTGNLASDPPGMAPRTFLFDAANGQFFTTAGVPITEPIEQRPASRTAPDPTTAAINRLRLQGLEEDAAAAAQYQEIPSNYRTAFDRATASLPATRRGPQRALVARLWEEGNIPGVQEFIRQMAVEGEDVSTQSRVQGRREAIRQLDDLDATLTELEEAGVDTGPVSGRMEDLARRVGTSTDTRLAALGNQMLVALQSYRLAVTGVQFGFNESQQYEGMFPNYRNQLPVNRALLSGLRRSMSLNQQGFWKDKLGEAGAALVEAPAGAGAGAGVTSGAPSPAAPTNPFR